MIKTKISQFDEVNKAEKIDIKKAKIKNIKVEKIEIK